MKKTVYQINSFQEIDKISDKPAFTLPLSSHLYYGLEYIVSGLDLYPDLNNKFFINIGDHFVMCFEICNTKIRNVITSTMPHQNILTMLEKFNIKHYLDTDLSINDDF